MDHGNHPDPFGELSSDGLQRAVQITSCAVTAAQVYIYQQRTQARIVAERDELAQRTLRAQGRADRDASRAEWAPALDPNWHCQADLISAARAWGAAAPFADRSVPWYEPTAVTAMRRCEERLRVLHPHAMARYDRLRAYGAAPADAMREAAPLFGRPPRPHDTSYAPVPALETGQGEDPGPRSGPEPLPGSVGDLSGAEQDQPLASERNRGTDLGTAADVQAASGTGHTANLAGSRDTATATARASRAARPGELDLPMPIRDVIAAAGQTTPAPGSPAAAQRSSGTQATSPVGRQP